MVVGLEKKNYRRKPQPKFFREQLVSPNAVLTFKNRQNEVSQIEYIRVYGLPYFNVKVDRTIAGDIQNIVEDSPLWRFPHGMIMFKETPTDSNLTLGEDQTLTITITNPKSAVGDSYCSVHIEKDQILVYEGESNE